MIIFFEKFLEIVEKIEKCLENETKSPEIIENCSMPMYKKADLLRKRLSVKNTNRIDLK